MENVPIIIIAGPTASGKTGTANRLALEFNGEIISADAMAVYKMMDIGTAKPTREEMADIPIHMIDVVNPDEPFDAACFAEKGDKYIEEITARGKTPFVAGGSGLYIKALTHGLVKEVKSDPDIKARLEKEILIKGKDVLYARLMKLDPESGARIHENDIYRILRALEIIEITGKPVSAIYSGHAFSSLRYNALMLCLEWEREELYNRINKRVEIMMAQGFILEVKGLMAKGFGPELKSMGALGYRHISAAIAGDFSMEKAVELMKRDTRRFAKRQITWFKKHPGAIWVDARDFETMRKMITEHLS